MTIMSTYVVIRSLDGTERYRLEEADGHRLAAVSRPGTKWRRRVTTSPVVDGRFEAGAVKDGDVLDLTARVKGSSWAQAETRMIALEEAAFEEPYFLLEVSLRGTSRTYRANRPDITPAEPEASDLRNCRLVSLLSFPIQPNPTVTGI